MRVVHVLAVGAMVMACGGEEGTGAFDRDRQTQEAAAGATCATLESDCSARCTGSFENVECTGALSGSFDNVVVPPGATCTLTDALLTGNLIVEEDASATTGPDVFVCGNLQGDKAQSVSTSGTRVCDNLQINESGTGQIDAGTEVLKNAEFKKSSSISVADTVVCVDAQFVENGSVSLPAGAPTLVRENCSSDENSTFDFSGINVLGDNDGCAGAQ